MSGEAREFGHGEMAIGTIEIQLVLTAEGSQEVWMRHYDNNDEELPLLTVLGMLEMSKDTAYHMAAHPVDEEDGEDNDG